MSGVRVFDGEVLVIGAGPAGTVVARRLAAAGHRVDLLETGSWVPYVPDRDRRTSVIDTELGPRDIRTQTSTGVGGTAHLWGVRLDGWRRGIRLGAPHEHDLIRPGRAADEQWPFGLDELTPHLIRALGDVVGPGDHRLDASPLAGFSTDRTTTHHFWFARQQQFTDPRRTDHPLIRLHRRTRAVRLARDRSGRVASIEVVEDGRRRTIDVGGRPVVLSTGTVQALRLLFASDVVDQAPDGPLGRYFMERPRYRSYPVVADRSLVEGALHDLRAHEHRMSYLRVGGSADGPSLAITPWFDPADHPHERLHLRLGEVHERMRYLYERMPRVLGSHSGAVRAAATGAVDLLERASGRQQHADWDHLEWTVPGDATLRFHLRGLLEHLPHPDNRLRPTGVVDCDGLVRAGGECRLLRDEQAKAADVLDEYAGELERRGMHIDRSSGAFSVEDVTSNHHMGGARMGLDPAASVVDPHLTVHGCDNLSVCTLAVMPSSGFVNPTLTLLALAHRLSDRLCAGEQ